MKGDGNSSGPVVHRSWILEQEKQLTGNKDRFGG